MAFSPYGYWPTIPARSRVAHGLHRGEAARAAVADQFRCAEEEEEERRREGPWWLQDEIFYEEDFPPGYLDPPWVEYLTVEEEPLRWTLGG